MDASTGCLSVVMPAYNEEQTIDEIIHRVLARTEVGELLIINDASTDKTWENLPKFADNPRIRLFNQEVNQGKGAALIRGFREAARPFVIVQDADFEYTPEDYPAVLAPLLDVVTTTDQGIVSAIKNSSVVRWLLKFTNPLRPETLKEQAKNFADNYLATASGTGVAAVDSKADAQQIDPKDYVPNAEQMDRTTQRIYALFNTNAHIVDSSRSEDEWNAYFDAEIEPVLRQLGGEYTRKLFSLRERGFGNRIVFEASSWDGASLGTKLNLMQMVDRGALTPNEWRLAFNLAPVPGGDAPIRRLDTARVQEGATTE